MENDLLSIYGARLSKNGKYINVTLVKGEGDAKAYFTACVKLNKEAKTHGIVKNGKAIISIPMLEATKKPAKKAAGKDEAAIDEDDLPF